MTRVDMVLWRLQCRLKKLRCKLRLWFDELAGASPPSFFGALRNARHPDFAPTSHLPTRLRRALVTNQAIADCSATLGLLHNAF
jgi:hypothetical protein